MLLVRNKLHVEYHESWRLIYHFSSICRKCQGGGGYVINIMGLVSVEKVYSTMLWAESQLYSSIKHWNFTAKNTWKHIKPSSTKPFRLKNRSYGKIYSALMHTQVMKCLLTHWGSITNSGNVRYFCGDCGSHLFAYDKQYAEYVYPYASAIDTPLPEPKPDDIYRIMLNDKSKCNWATTPKPDERRNFLLYPDTSLEDWHKAHHQFIERK